ncbi:hypothetical protein K5N30_002721 [Vibrio parahaemolyticus]|nr:hypothetical protein [Vibrio parahaemolyticus]
MKIGLKIATVVCPIPTVYWVIKGEHPKWVKTLSVIWAIFTALIFLASSQSADGFEGYPSFVIASLITFGITNGLFSLFRKAIQKAKQQSVSQKKNVSSAEVSEPTTQPKASKTASRKPKVSEPDILTSEWTQPSSEKPEVDQPIQQSTSSEETEPYIETLTPRREYALYKLALQILEDDEVELEESKKLRTWLRRYPESKEDFRTKELYETVEEVLEDKVLDSDEALELFALLSDFCDSVEKRESDKASKEKALKAQPKKLKAKPKASLTSVSNYSFLNELKLGNEYFMSYSDASGKTSDRNIILNKVDVNQQDQHYIKAHCLLRNSQRTFRVDRIVALCDVDTGEAFV